MKSLNLKFIKSQLLKTFLEKYQLWLDYKLAYEQIDHAINGIKGFVSRENLPAINCYMSTDLGSISQDPNKIVFIDNLTETINLKGHFYKYPNDKYYVFFSNGIWDSDYYQLPFEYCQVNYMYFLFDMTDLYLSDNRFSFYINKTYKFDYPKPYNFVATAGSKRPEKDGFVTALLENISYKNFVLKYHGQDFGQPYNDSLLNRSAKDFNSNQNLPGLEKYFHSLSQTLPIDLYNLGYFNLLLEGDISWECQFNPTEKTVKTLVSGMPFVMVSSPFFLKHLKKLGFETYSSLWNESYDEIVDYDLRMSTIVNLCNQLASFDWAAHKDKLQAIANTNRANFFNLNRVANQHFESFTQVMQSISSKLEPYLVDAE